MPEPTNNPTPDPTHGTELDDSAEPPEQPEPESSSDGDGSWTADPQTQDPDEDRSVDEVIRRTSHQA